MPRYIDAEKLCELAKNHINKSVDCNDIMRIPFADVQEVRHGKWLPTSHPDQKRCSVCDVRSFIALYPCINKADYCPHCGAKMDGKEDEE